MSYEYVSNRPVCHLFSTCFLLCLSARGGDGRRDARRNTPKWIGSMEPASQAATVRG
jgi:hypothetical protein